MINKEEEKAHHSEEGTEKSYTNPFERNNDHEEDFNDRDDDFLADDIILKSKNKPKSKKINPFDDQNTHPNEENRQEEKGEIEEKNLKIPPKTEQENKFNKTSTTDEEEELQRRMRRLLDQEISEGSGNNEEEDVNESTGKI